MASSDFEEREWGVGLRLAAAVQLVPVLFIEHSSLVLITHYSLLITHYSSLTPPQALN